MSDYVPKVGDIVNVILPPLKVLLDAGAPR